MTFASVAAHASVNPCEDRQWHAENIKGCDNSVSQRQTCASKCFVATRAYADPLLTVLHTTTAVEPAKKFHVFHQRHLGKSANIEEGSSPAEYPVIAAAHSQQDACVMSEAVRESINQALRQANPEVTANDSRIIHDARNLIQTSLWDFSIDMHEPKQVAASGACAGVHLPGTTAIARDKLITKAESKPICAIGASAVCNNNLRFRRSLAQVLKEWSYQRRFVKNRDNDRQLRSNAFLQIA